MFEPRSLIALKPAAALALAASIASLVLALAASIASPAHASTVAGWWKGDWDCRIDGRPAKMKWTIVNADQGRCDGDTCTSASAVAWKGSFSDNGSRWVPLTNARTGDQGGMFFNHADGNRWYLRKPVGSKASGWTTWQGKRYPLACER